MCLTSTTLRPRLSEQLGGCETHTVWSVQSRETPSCSDKRGLTVVGVRESRETPSCSDKRGLTVVDVRHIQYGQYRVERHQVVRINEV